MTIAVLLFITDSPVLPSEHSGELKAQLRKRANYADTLISLLVRHLE